ncbi:MAG: hypothetical protein JO132_09360 [Streptosporangiaceae bacterium]|nr:hypothetical protein [Streptosporangiaceae bacterium]
MNTFRNWPSEERSDSSRPPGDQPPDEEAAGWPGVAPPAEWFLRAPYRDEPDGTPAEPPAEPEQPSAASEQAPANPEERPADQQQPSAASEEPLAASEEPPADPEELPADQQEPAAPPVAAAGLSLWQRSQRLWREAGIAWDVPPADSGPASHPGPAPHPGPAACPGPAPHSGPAPRSGTVAADPAPAAPLHPGRVQFPLSDVWSARVGQAAARPLDDVWSARVGQGAALPLSAPVFGGPDSGQDDDPAADAVPPRDPGADLPPTARRPPNDTLLLEPAPPQDWSPDAKRGPHTRRGPGSRRRAAAIAVPVAVLVAVAAVAVTLLTGHGPKPGQLAANQQLARHIPPLPTIGTYPGQQQRGVFQTIDRVTGYGPTIVATGSQSSDGLVRQQFFTSPDGGASWRLAPTQAAGGGQAPLGHPATRIAGGPDGWLAVGPQAIWTSKNGMSWTLAATHGITPQQAGDQVWVITNTATGFLAGGVAALPGGGTQAVIWTTRDGLSWQRTDAARLPAAPGETVQDISFAASRGGDTVIAGTVSGGGSGVWLSTDGGSTWTPVTVPVDHGATAGITGLSFDAAGLLAVRPGRTAGGTADGVAYFSSNGHDWQYTGTIDPSGGWQPQVVKGNSYGFVVTGTTDAGAIVAYTSTGTGSSWAPTGSLGASASESLPGVTIAPAGTVVAAGSADATGVSQQAVLVRAKPGGAVRQVPLGTIPGAVVSELDVRAMASAGGVQVAVGSADGYPAIWRRDTAGSWMLASPQLLASASPGLGTLTGVTHGAAGWLAVGEPGPVVLTSADGTTWRPAAGNIAADLAGVSAVAAAAGPRGYVIVGKLVAPGRCIADVWWSPNLATWTRAHDVNDATGSSQVLAVVADADGFVSAGSHNRQPALWLTGNGVSWTTIVLPLPAGASEAVLQQIAISSNGRVAALGQATTAAGLMPFAELSADGGVSWQQVPFPIPGPGTVFTALIARPGGFTAAGLYGPPGQQQTDTWTSADGTAWAQTPIGGVTGAGSGGAHLITALASSGSAVTGIGSVATQQSQGAFTVIVPDH